MARSNATAEFEGEVLGGAVALQVLGDGYQEPAQACTEEPSRAVHGQGNWDSLFGRPF